MQKEIRCEHERCCLYRHARGHKNYDVLPIFVKVTSAFNAKNPENLEKKFKVEHNHVHCIATVAITTLRIRRKCPK